jgi:hypothetical protein
MYPMTKMEISEIREVCGEEVHELIRVGEGMVAIL